MPISLKEIQDQWGAVPGECVGGPVQKHFGNPEFEYAAARSSAALFDLSDRTQIELTGGDRAKFLHNFCTNDIRSLKPGQGCEAFVCNVQAKTLGHIFVFAAPESLLIDSVPGANISLLKHLQKYHITEDVEFVDRTAEWGTLFLTGPGAAAVLACLQLPGEDLTPLEHTLADWNGTQLFIRRTDWLQLPGWEVIVPRDKLAEVWVALKDSGAKPAGSDAWEPLRLEAGLPVYGVDVTADNLAPEAGRNASTISYTKGCYLGQEPIARIDAMGHVNRTLRGIRFEPGAVPAAGSELVMNGDTDRVVGQVTSAAHSFQTGAPVAIGYLKRHYDTPGQAVRARSGGAILSGVIFTPDAERK
jgi:folate-binding protein YgfZ